MIHPISPWLSLAALPLFAIPVVLYIACTMLDSRAKTLRAAANYHLYFTCIVRASAGLIYLID